MERRWLTRRLGMPERPRLPDVLQLHDSRSEERHRPPGLGRLNAVADFQHGQHCAIPSLSHAESLFPFSERARRSAITPFLEEVELVFIELHVAAEYMPNPAVIVPSVHAERVIQHASVSFAHYNAVRWKFSDGLGKLFRRALKLFDRHDPVHDPPLLRLGSRKELACEAEFVHERHAKFMNPED